MTCNHVLGIWILLNYFTLLHLPRHSVLLHLLCLIKPSVPASSLPVSLTFLGCLKHCLQSLPLRKLSKHDKKKTFLIVLQILLLNSVFSVRLTQLWQRDHHYHANRYWHLRVLIPHCIYLLLLPSDSYTAIILLSILEEHLVHKM